MSLQFKPGELRELVERGNEKWVVSECSDSKSTFMSHRKINNRL